MKRVGVAVAVVVVAILLLTRCGPSEDEFREADADGYAACEAFESAQGAGGEVYHDRIGRAADLGAAASTPEIQDAVLDETERDGAPVIDDLDAFEDACSGAGYDF
jgi:hypothetical protein